MGAWVDGGEAAGWNGSEDTDGGGVNPEVF